MLPANARLAAVRQPLMALLLAALPLACCSPGQAERRATRDRRGAPTGAERQLDAGTSSAGAAPGAPLVVAVVFDQLGSDTLLAHRDLLDERGILRRAMAEGAYFERSEYPYSNTQTAPGHASIHTGAPPAKSGIDGNSVWDVASGRVVAATLDERYPVIGLEAAGSTAGPGRLEAETVAQSLKRATYGAGKVISLSVKARSAILSAGPTADVVLWFEGRVGGFTSSRAWGQALPAWLIAHEKTHPVTALLQPWLPRSESVYRERLGPDDAPGEGDLDGFGTVFPHTFDNVAAPLDLLPCAPQFSEYLVGLAARAAEAEGLGRDVVPDLLAISISGTDTAGHTFGPDSWEYVDHLVRADLAIGSWWAELEKSTPAALLITSDHGVARLPETKSEAAGRIAESDLQRHLEEALVMEFGTGPHVARVLAPFVHFSPAARARKDFARVLERALVVLRSHPALAEAWLMSEVRAWGEHADRLKRAAAAGVSPHNPADISFVTRPHYSLDMGAHAGKGTNHGSPHEYDRQVPVLAIGQGVPHRHEAAPVNQLRVAATLARLLGVPAPRDALPEPLF